MPQGQTMHLGIAAQAGRGDAGFSQFHAVADKPALEGRQFAGFGMELQPEDGRSHGKGLGRAGSRPGKTISSGRDIECFAMPVQNGHIRKMAERAPGTSLGQRKGGEADFLLWHGANPGAKRCRHELRAKADAECGATGGEAQS